MPLGRRVVVIGGGLVGAELAEFLSDRGRDVCVLEEGDCLAAEMAPPRRWRVLHRLREAGVQLKTGARVTAIDDAGVHYRDGDGPSSVARADSVILAADTRDDREGAQRFADLAPEVFVIGDCDGLGYIQGAILDGARAAHRI
jgi:2,4-dienoyl-CoA reductase (NADPH2)